MKILKLTAENVKKLRVVEITPTGELVQLTGANGEGKSSVLDSILYGLAGTKSIPGTPVRIGEEKARVQLDLGEIVVTRKFGKDGSTSLVVESAEGARYPSPQKLLDDLMGSLSFDPLQFASMSAKEQFAQLRALVPLSIDLDQLERNNAEDFEERTTVNRRWKEAEARAVGILVPAETPAVVIDVAPLLEQMESAASHNAAIEKMDADRETARREWHSMQTSIEGWRQQAQSLLAQADGMAKILADATDAAATWTAAPARIDVSDVRAEIDRAQVVNVQVARRAMKAAALVEVDELRTASEDLTAQIDKRRQAKDAALFAAQMPIDGLGFGDGVVLFEGLPLEQASDAQKLRVSIALAMAANPKLRVLRIKQGSLLDSKSVAILRDMLKAHDFQCWMECVDESGTVGIVMEDGNARVAEKSVAA